VIVGQMSVTSVQKLQGLTIFWGFAPVSCLDPCNWMSVQRKQFYLLHVIVYTTMM